MVIDHMDPFNPQSLWSREYEAKGIPSSYETEPSLASRFLHTWLQDRDIQTGRLLDIGCGLGRNSFFFAENGFQVSAIDFAATNIAWLQQEAQRRDLPIEANCLDVGKDQWPFQDRYFRLAIDIFCFKHLVDEDSKRHYKEQLRKVLKQEGLFLLSLASVKDGFYGPLLKQSPKPDRKLIIDPFSQISSLLYTREDIEKEFSDQFALQAFIESHSVSPMHGRDYSRTVLSFIFGSKH